MQDWLVVKTGENKQTIKQINKPMKQEKQTKKQLNKHINKPKKRESKQTNKIKENYVLCES